LSHIVARSTNVKTHFLCSLWQRLDFIIGSLLFVVTLNGVAATDLVQPAKCKHFWRNGAERIHSGLKTGVDVGESPFGSDGVYECEIYLSKADYLQGKSIFVGEVGDSSYFKLKSVNGAKTDLPILSHGLWPLEHIHGDMEPKYTAFIPFVIPIEQVWRGAGDYNFEIHYKDLFPGKAGIRSGLITTESTVGVLYRFAVGSPVVVACLLQTIYCLFALILILSFRSSPNARTILVATSTLLIGLSTFQLSGVTRYFLPIKVAPFINFALQMVTFTCIARSICFLIRDYSGMLTRISRCLIFLCVAIFSIDLVLGSENPSLNRLLYGIGFTVAGVFGSAIASWALLTKRAVFFDSLSPSFARGIWFLVLALMFLLDMLNWQLLHARYVFLTHIFYFSSVVTIFLHSEISLHLNSLKYIKRLRAISNSALARLSRRGESVHETLSEMSGEFGKLFGAQRVSLIEINEEKIRLLGIHGDYADPTGIYHIGANSVLAELQRTGIVQRGWKARHGQPEMETEFWAIPIFSEGRVRGAVCLTDFVHGFMMPFYERHLDVFRKDVESCIHYLFSRCEELHRELASLRSAHEVSQASVRRNRQVAHDIRSPLSALGVFSSFADKLAEKERLLFRRAVDRISDIANRLSEATQQAETLGSRPATRLHSVQPIATILESIVPEKRLQYQYRTGVEIIADLAAGYGLFSEIDPVELKRIISNLVNNAVEAIPRNGKVTIDLRASNGIQISIADTGDGIPPERLPFLGREGVTFGKVGGSGIGLHHAISTIRSWGGEVKIRSAVGEGTCVVISLPLANSPRWFAPELLIDRSKPVVILDDDASVHQVWEHRFSESNLVDSRLEPIHFFSAEDFRAWVHGNRGAKDVTYLIDQELVGERCTGVDLIKELQIGKHSTIVTSHYEREELRAHCVELGAKLLPKAWAAHIPIRVLGDFREKA
jgi:signal transduction histidine kinase